MTRPAQSLDSAVIASDLLSSKRRPTVAIPLAQGVLIQPVLQPRSPIRNRLHHLLQAPIHHPLLSVTLFHSPLLLLRVPFRHLLRERSHLHLRRRHWRIGCPRPVSVISADILLQAVMLAVRPICTLHQLLVKQSSRSDPLVVVFVSRCPLLSFSALPQVTRRRRRTGALHRREPEALTVLDLLASSFLAQSAALTVPLRRAEHRESPSRFTRRKMGWGPSQLTARGRPKRT